MDNVDRESKMIKDDGQELGLFMVLFRSKNVLQECYTNMCDVV